MTVRGLHSDRGFTLTELVVVLALMGFVLSVAYATFTLVRNGSDMSNRESVFGQEVGAPLDIAERLLTQQFAFDSAAPGVGPYRCAFYTDRDNDGRRERYVIEATADGRLVTSFTEEIDAPTPRTGVWSDRNFNVSDATPLFRYLDQAGVEITAMSDVYAYARSVDVTIVTREGGRTLSDTRRAFFRNR